MAFQVGSTCYSTPAGALSAAASSQVGTVVSHGGSAYVVDASSVTASSISYRLTPVGGGTPIASVVSMSPQPCGLLTAEDGAMLGWAIAAAWIATAVVINLRKAADL